MDIYEYLIGAPPGPEKQKAVAEALRKRSQLGTLGALSGDRVLAPFGQGLMKQADNDASSLQQTRQMDIDNAQSKWYQGAQINHMGNVLKETIRNNNLDYDAAMAGVNADMFRATLSGNKPRNLTLGDRNKLEKMANGFTGAMDVISKFKDDYTQPLGPGPQSSIPNTLASIGIGTKGTKEAADWWANWRVIYTLGERNNLFGATLTPNEQQAWMENEIRPGMSADQIRSRMAVLTGIMQRKASLMKKTYAQQFDPEVIESYGLPEPEYQPPPVGGGEGGMTVTSSSSGKAPQSIEDIDARIRALTEMIESMPDAN